MSRSSSLRSFLGCLAIVICLARSSSSCFDKPGFLDLAFPDSASFEIGSEIRIPCRLKNKTYADSNESWHTEVDYSNLAFRLNGESLDLRSGFVEKINETTIAFVKKNATVKDSASLFCYGKALNNKNEPTILAGCGTTVTVGTRPQQVRDFKCTSHSFVNMTCTWENPENKVPTKYTIEISYGVTRTFGTTWKPCPAEQAGPNFCSWSASTEPSYDKMAPDFLFRISGTNALGNDSWNYNLNQSSIVKLSPVVHLEATKTSPREVKLTWDAPHETNHGGWKQNMSIVYTVTFQRTNSSLINTTTLTDRQLSLGNLVPNHKYEFAVSAKTSSTSRFDLESDPIRETVYIESARPDKPPTLLPSAFKYKLFNDVRTVTLLFSEIPRENWNDNSLEYIIRVCSRPDDMCYNKTVPSTNVELEDLSLSKRYIIDVWSVNSLGPSSESSTLYLPPQSELLALPTNVDDEIGNHTVTLRWRTPPTLAGLNGLMADVFWCGSRNKRQCQGEIFMKRVENNGSYRIEVNDTRDFIYGVALYGPGGNTSGSVWSICEINVGAHVGQVRELEALPDTDTTLMLKWKTGCGSQRESVKGYQVEYCQMDSFAKDVLTFPEECQHRRPANSSESCNLLNFTLPTEDDIYRLEGLQAGSVYRVILRPIDGHTDKFAPDSMAVCTKAEGRALLSLTAVLIVIGGSTAFFVIALGVWCCARRVGGEIASTKKNAIRLPFKSAKIDKLNPPQNRGTEMKVIEGNNGIYPDINVQNMTSTFNRGSHSGLDKLIQPSTLDGLLRDSGESPNLKREPQTVLNMQPPRVFVPTVPTAVAPVVIQQTIPNGDAQYPASPMPPYTQLGLSSTHFVAAPEQPRNTGYSQLSVVPSDPPAVDENDEQGDGDENYDDYDDEDRAPSPEPERPSRLGPNPGYVACNVMGNAAPKPSASSNGYVPAVSTAQ